MADTIISISVDAATAQAYHEASIEHRKKIELLLRLQICELLNPSSVSLQQLMDEMGAKAEARGMITEILETLLDDE